MTGNGAISTVPVEIAVKTGPAGVGVDAHFDVRRLVFVSAHGRKRQLLLVIAALYDQQGRFVRGQRGTVNLVLDDLRYKRIEKNALGATLRVAAPPGRYRRG